MDLIGANVLCPQPCWGEPKKLAELLDGVDVGSLRRWRKVADAHILDNAAAKRADLGHLAASCLGVGCDAQILSDRRPLIDLAAPAAASGLVQSPAGLPRNSQVSTAMTRVAS